MSRVECDAWRVWRNATVQKWFELAAIVRNAQQRIQLGKRATVAEEIRGEFYASLRALMAQVPGGGWR